MKSIKTILLIVIGIFIFNGINAQLTNSTTLKEKEGLGDAEEIIQSYVSDYQNDRFAADAMLFGIEIPDQGSWTVTVTGNKTEKGWEVLLEAGLPKTPTFIYVIEYETLKAIHEGIINALTAQGKAFAGDYTPMSIKQMEGYEPSMEEYAKINPFSFHFWTRGFPEIIPFGEGKTRRAHGSNFTVFYYQTGLRTAWYRVLPEERVRDDAREQAAPFPMLIVAIKGTTEGEVDGQLVSLSEGNTIFIPAGVAHKWWNETDKATEAILIMFGEGA
ncbi:cupin domain-containing protein [Sediminicola sp. YIK13]|uniref:cupin domain-containing protein n=1 Tax=Sediminicola sp. YIK13 TaxID=1453352 RepID=UPI00138F6C54|nr:cupin domain-containing protein [Sediminicola sp. YIK13]